MLDGMSWFEPLFHVFDWFIAAKHHLKTNSKVNNSNLEHVKSCCQQSKISLHPNTLVV